MRHQTTAYDSMPIPRVNGKRREVRRMLAQRSKELLARYRRGELNWEECPLVKALPSPTTLFWLGMICFVPVLTASSPQPSRTTLSVPPRSTETEQDNQSSLGG